jgi:thiopeptide-type bacteriocin biosynthesis protein
LTDDLRAPPEAPQFHPARFFVLRTPLLPFDEYERWTADLELPTAGDDPAEVERALAADRERLRRGLADWLERPEIREALFLASPDLVDALESWRRDPGGRKGRRTERALVRYLLRMLARATPFGLFSGCSTGRVGDETRLRLRGRGDYRRHSRLDMDYLSNLADDVARDPAARRDLVFRPSSSLYVAAGRLRYAEPRLEGRRRKYHLVALDRDDYLEATLERARGGARIAELAAAAVADHPEIAPEEAEAFVHELIDTRVLMADLAPLVTGEEPIDEMIRHFREVPATARRAERLEDVRARLEELDASPFGAWAPERYRRLAADLEELGTEVELGRFLQVDMSKPGDGLTLGEAVIAELRRAVRILRRLGSDPGIETLEAFRKAFIERYESGTEMPLLEVLDEEIGIGFQRSSAAMDETSPLLLGLPLGRAPERRVVVGARDTFLLRKLEEALGRGWMKIGVEESELADLSGDPVTLPDAFHAMGELMADSAAALARGEFRLRLQGIAGPSGARLLGRFCHTDPELLAGVEEHLRSEEALESDAVFAEIVHLPEGRIGNILRRPVLRRHEIPFLGRSGAPPELRIPASDLRVSVTPVQIVLRSERFGKRVIPRLTTAHNFSRGDLGLYRFLATLQNERGVPSLRWSWGLLESAAFLPRVVSGRVVLSRARWRVEKKEIVSLVQARGAERVARLRAWREDRRLPRLVLLADFDNELLVDFDNVLSMESFLDLVKERDSLVLKELLPAPEQLCAEGPEGRFFHELLVPFVSERPARGGPVLPRAPIEVVKSYPPGSEWLYARLYTGSSTADQVLREVVAPLTRLLARGEIAESWFFLRYGDPEWHLRVRFAGDPERLWTKGLPHFKKILEPLLADGRVWRFELSTYQREIPRYGGAEGIELAERVFHADSEAVLAIVETLAGDAGADARWRLAFRGMDALLDDFGFDLEAKKRLAEIQARSFAGRLGFDESLTSQLAVKLRSVRRTLLQSLERPEDLPHLEPGFAALRRRSAALAPLAAEIRRRAGEGRLTVGLEELVPHFIHMFVNRLTRSAGPEHELVLYDFLARIYMSQIARARKKT